MVGFDVGISEFEMDGFARKFTELAREEEGMLLEDMPKGTPWESCHRF